MPTTNLIKSVKSGGIVVNLKELERGDKFTLKGDNSTDTAEIVLNESSNTYSSKLKSAAISSDIVFTLPDSDGVDNQLFGTDGNGVFSWVNNSFTVVEDLTPQLGSDLDVNGNVIVSVSNGDVEILPNGTGSLLLDGDGTTGGITIENGSIDVKNGGSVSFVKLYDENSNDHYTQIQSSPHASYSEDVFLTLPTSATSSTLAYSSDVPNNFGEREFVATGAISAGNIIGLRADGTVEVITETITDYPTSGGTISYFTDAVDGSLGYETDAVFIPSSNKIFVSYRKQISSKYACVYKIATISGDTISFGTENTIIADINNNCYGFKVLYDPNTDQIIFFYTYNGVNQLRVKVGTLSGSTVSFGSEIDLATLYGIQVYSKYTSDVFIDPDTDKILMIYGDWNNNSYYPTAIVGTISSNSISFGTKTVLASNYIVYNNYISITHDSSQNKMIVSYAYYQNTSTVVYFRLFACTISGTSIVKGSDLIAPGSNYTLDKNKIIYIPNINKTVYLYGDSSTNLYLRFLTIGPSTYTISASSQILLLDVGFNYELEEYMSDVLYHESLETLVLMIWGYIIPIYISSSLDVSLGSVSYIQSYPSVSGYLKLIYDTNVNKMAAFFMETTPYKGVSYVLEPAHSVLSTNADSWLGIASENISNGASGTINIKNAINSNQSGLSIGSTYYVNYDGTLTTTENAGPIDGTYGKIGKAIASNKLLITQGNA